MSPDIPGLTVTVTKNADGSFTWTVQRPNGSVFVQFTHPSADMTTINALGSGASATFNYAENTMANLNPNVFNVM